MAYDYRKGWVVNPNAPTESLEAKLAYVDNGTQQIDPDRYYDPDFMAREWNALWTRTWLIAAVASDIPEQGDYSVFRLRHEAILIVRQANGNVRAHL